MSQGMETTPPGESSSFKEEEKRVKCENIKLQQCLMLNGSTRAMRVSDEQEGHNLQKYIQTIIQNYDMTMKLK